MGNKGLVASLLHLSHKDTHIYKVRFGRKSGQDTIYRILAPEKIELCKELPKLADPKSHFVASKARLAIYSLERGDFTNQGYLDDIAKRLE